MSRGGRFVVSVVIGSVLFLGLSLLGWGVADIQGFMSQPARLAYSVLVIVLQFIIAAKFPEAGRNQGQGTRLVRRQQIAVGLLQVLSLAMVIVSPWSDRHNLLAFDGADFLRYVGLILFAPSFLAMNWVEATLGKLFSVQVTVQEGHRLITGGPFRYLRHPRYLGIMLMNVGIALVFRSGLGLLLAAGLIGVLLWRIHDEEALMHQAFGAEWEAYMQKSWRLIPLVY